MQHYLEHNTRFCDYLLAKENLINITNEKDAVQARTEPKISYEERVSGTPKNKTEEYVIEMERRQLNRRIAEAEAIIKAKKYLLDLAEEELRKSRDIYDLVYTKRWIDHKRPKDIYRELDLMGMGYSRSHIYEIIKRIKQTTGRDF